MVTADIKYALEAALVYVLTGGKSRSREWMIKTIVKTLGMGDVDVEGADNFAMQIAEDLKKRPFPLLQTIVEREGRLWIEDGDGNGRPTNITISKGSDIPNCT